MLGRSRIHTRFKNPSLGFAEFAVSLFSNGEEGAWFDPSDLSTLFQDSAGTIPVTADGNPVGLMRDKSGNGHHATQVTAGSRPIFRTSGGLSWLEFDGVDDFLLTNTLTLAAVSRLSVFSGVRKLSDGATGLIAEYGAAAGANPSFGMFGPSGGGVNKFDFRIRGTSTAIAATTNAAFNAPVTAVVTGLGDLAAPLTVLRLNGAQAASTAAATGGGTFGNQPIYIGRSAGVVLPFNGLVYGLIIRGASSNTTEVAGTEKYLALKSGVSI